MPVDELIISWLSISSSAIVLLIGETEFPADEIVSALGVFSQYFKLILAVAPFSPSLLRQLSVGELSNLARLLLFPLEILLKRSKINCKSQSERNIFCLKKRNYFKKEKACFHFKLICTYGKMYFPYDVCQIIKFDLRTHKKADDTSLFVFFAFFFCFVFSLRYLENFCLCLKFNPTYLKDFKKIGRAINKVLEAFFDQTELNYTLFVPLL